MVAPKKGKGAGPLPPPSRCYVSGVPFVQCYILVSERWRYTYIKMVGNTLSFNVMNTSNSKYDRFFKC